MFSRPDSKGQINALDKDVASLTPPLNSFSPLSVDTSGRSFIRSEPLFSSRTSAIVPSLSYANATPAVEGYASMTSSLASNDKEDENELTNSSVTMHSTPVTSTVRDSNGNVRRKYSRNGCSECKRRRIKCDETKPTCWQCARLNRACVYVSNPRNKKRKLKDKVNEKKSLEKEQKVKRSQNLPSEKENLNDMQLLELPNVIPVGSMDGYDANLLIQNLNDIVSMKLNDSLLDNENLKDLELPNLDIPELMPPSTTPLSTVPISFLVNNVITFNTKLSSFKLGAVHKGYLKVFFNDCLDTIAPFFQGQENPLRDIILSFARNESYLLSATLAVGASIAHRKSNDLEDERNYCAYLSHCLSLLGEQFQNESNVLTKIEPIILTVIMLAWDCINTMNSQWRSHLKGVTDLFKKISSGDSSKVMNVAKCWFKVMETFASISTVLGGSVTDDNDLDLIFDPYDYQYVDSLKFLNIMTPLNEFNLLRGHREDFDLVIKEVIKALTSIRKSEKYYLTKEEDIFTKNLDYLLWTAQTGTDKPTEPLCYFKTQKILVEIDRQLNYQFIDKSGVIPNDSQSHPNNSNIDDNAIDLVTLKNGETIAISWYDISHQTQVLSFLLIVLLKLLGIPKESITIQQVVKKILSFFKFLDSDSPPENSRTCYSNFAVLIAGLNAMDEETRNIVRSYYKLNGGRFQRLTEHNLNRLEKVWYGKDAKYRMADQDVLTW